MQVRTRAGCDQVDCLTWTEGEAAVLDAHCAVEEAAPMRELPRDAGPQPTYTPAIDT